MYHRVTKEMFPFFSAILILSFPLSLSKSIDTTTAITSDNEVNNNIIDFDEEFELKVNKKYGMVPYYEKDFDKNKLKYTVVKETLNINDKLDVERKIDSENDRQNNKGIDDSTTEDFRVIPLELLSTTQDPLISIIESTIEPDLTVIPLSTTEKIQVTIEETVTLPSTPNYVTEFDVTTENDLENSTTQSNLQVETLNITTSVESINETSDANVHSTFSDINITNHNTTQKINNTDNIDRVIAKISNDTSKVEDIKQNTTKPTDTEDKTPLIDEDTAKLPNNTRNLEDIKHNTTKDINEDDVPIFTEPDTEEEVPEDYYDSKDVVPTTAPKTDAISVLFGLAGSVVESVVETVAERVVPRSIYDLFKRMQRQNEALEAERLRSREENGGLGQFGRGILKSISSGLSKPLTQLMETKNGSLDTDRGFVASVATSVSSVANVATSLVDAFKDKVQAIYPGTVWCGDGHSAQARSGELGLFFFTDTCCRQHDACRLYLRAGDTKYGLTNTGLFTRSHCACDQQFLSCLRRTNSLVSAQIGLTYFNVLAPQCFRKAHPITRCKRKTRITGMKCEEYELDYTKPKMWQWFDNETF